MHKLWRAGVISTAFLALAACDNGAKQPTAPVSPPVRTACTTPEEAGHKMADITKKLAEALTAKRITEDDYRGYNATLGTGLRAWSEHQDLKGYCAALDKVVTDAALP